MVRFSAAGLIVLLALATVIGFDARGEGVEKATQAAEQVTRVVAAGLVAPHLDRGVVDGDPGALARFDGQIRRYVLHMSLVRVKLWAVTGRVVYSDEARLIGRTFPLGPERAGALDDRRIQSSISDLTRPENRFEVPYRKLLEVYAPVRDVDGDYLLFETYFRYEAVSRAGVEAWWDFAPPSLGALLVLQLVQIPFAWSLTRRLQRQQRDRERLLRHAIEASDAERRRIAGELHDGVVQELTGLAYGLDAIRLGDPDDERRAAVIANAGSRMRGSVAALRSLLVDIYPPNLEEEGLPAALTELAVGLERDGMDVGLETDGTERLPHRAAALLYRSAQEVLRNVASHSGARHVRISAGHDGGRARLVVDDDGCGFDEGKLTGRTGDGHLGLRALRDLLADAGGRLTVRSSPGLGTRVEAEVPLE